MNKEKYKIKMSNIKNIKTDIMFMLKIKTLKILKVVLNMLLDIVVDQLSVKIELLVTMAITLLSATMIIKMKSTMK